MQRGGEIDRGGLFIETLDRIRRGEGRVRPFTRRVRSKMRKGSIDRVQTKRSPSSSNDLVADRLGAGTIATLPPNERGLEVEKRAIFHSSLQLRAECMRGWCLNKYSIVHSDAEEEEAAGGAGHRSAHSRELGGPTAQQQHTGGTHFLRRLRKRTSSLRLIKN